MATGINHIPFYRRISIPDGTLLIAVTIYSVPCAIALCLRPAIGAVLLLAPFILLFVNHGPAAIYLLISTTFVFIQFEMGISVLPADIAALLLFGAYITDLLMRGSTGRKNRLAMPFLLYLLAALISILLEGLTGLSIRYFTRQLLIFGTFMAIFHFGRRLPVRHVIYYFVGSAVINSIYALITFIRAGGAIRAFGLAGPGYGDHAMLAFVIASILFIWNKDIRGRIIWGICTVIMMSSLAATQTRASVITAAVMLLFSVLISWKMARHMEYEIPIHSIKIAAISVLILIPIIATYTPIFGGVLHRFERIGPDFGGTLLLRVVLWKAALSAFIDNPVFGIGAGNFAMIYRWVPDIKFETVYFLIYGLSTHVVFLSILTETGLVGLVTVIMLFGRAAAMSYETMFTAVNTVQMQEMLLLFVMAITIIWSSLYSGSWFWGNNSYHMAIFFGLIAARYKRP